MCGTDGVTYENICQLNAVKNMGDGTLDKDKDGPCTSGEPDVTTSFNTSKSKLGLYVPFNSQSHIGTSPQHCHLWDSNPQR